MTDGRVADEPPALAAARSTEQLNQQMTSGYEDESHTEYMLRLLLPTVCYVFILFFKFFKISYVQKDKNKHIGMDSFLSVINFRILLNLP